MAWINGNEILFSSILNTVVDDSREMPGIRSALIAKGGNIDENATYKDVPNAILDLPVGDTSYLAVEDNTVAYKKSILSGAAPLVNLKSIGGMTYKSNQLLPTGYWDRASGSGTYGGMTFTNHGDGSFTFDGTCEGTSIELFTVSWDNYPENFKKYSLYGDYLSFGATLPEGVECYLYLDGGDDTGSGALLTGSGGLTGASVNWRIASIYLNIPSGTVFNKLTINPMLNLGTTALPYEPYYEGLRDSKVTALKVYGANKLKLGSKTATSKGITAVADGENGTITLNGTATANASLVIIQPTSPFALEQGKTYTVSGMPSGIGVNAFWLSIQDTTYKQTIDITGTTPKTFTANYSNYYLYITVKSGYTADNIVITPTLHEGDTVKEPTVYAIPEAVQALDGYGDGLYGFFGRIRQNRITFNGVGAATYTKSCYRLTLNGSEGWKLLSSRANSFSLRLDFITEYGFTSEYEQFQSYDSVGTTNGIYMAASQTLYITDKRYATVEEFKSHLAEKPLIILYSTTTPEITDISVELKGFDNLIEVEPGGWIEFINKHSNAIPSGLSYIRRV